MVRIVSEIEIDRSPAHVRAVLLDFTSWPSWLTNGLVVTPLGAVKATTELKRGDRLRSDNNGTVVKPRILANSPTTFQWRGSFHGLVIGRRRFFFKESSKNPGGTTLVQEEDISGVLSFLFKPKAKEGRKAREAIQMFNSDIKARVESL